MPSSGTYLWSPELADMVDEAFERCKVDPSTLDISHVISARRSMNLLLTSWSGEDMQNWRIDRITAFPLVQGTATYTVDPDVDGRIVDVNRVSLQRDGYDTTIYPMSRDEWMDIPNKDIEGRPSRYFADKRQGSVEITLWNVPENSTDTLLMDVVRKFQDVGAASDTPDLTYYMNEAFASGLAYFLGRKFAPESIMGRLKGEYDDAFETANGAQRIRGDVTIVPMSNSRARRGGRAR